MKRWFDSMKTLMTVGLVAASLAATMEPAAAAPSGGTPRLEAMQVTAGAGSFTNNHVSTVMLLQRLDVTAAQAATGTVTVSCINALPYGSNSTLSVTNAVAIPIAGLSASTNNLDSQALYVGWGGIVNVAFPGTTNGTTVLSSLQLPF